MRRTSLFLDDKLLRAVKRVADRRRVSVAAVIREAVAGYLADPSGGGSVPSITGRFASGMHDTCEKVDDLLWSEPHA